MNREKNPACQLWNRAILFIMVIMLLAAAPLAAQEDSLQRVNGALHKGELNLKQAVLLEADLLFNPRMIPESSAFRPAPGEKSADKADRLALFEDVYRVYEELSPAEIAYLAALNPELKRVLAAAAAGQPPFPLQVRPHPPSAFDRINRAVAEGRISLKEAVLMQAQLKFVPGAALARPEFQPRAGEMAASGDCGTDFYAALHEVYNELTPAEIDWLKSLDPTLKVLLQVKAAEAAGITNPPLAPGAWGQWVNDLCAGYSLDSYVEGVNCIVHYTLATPSVNVTTQSYADLAKLYMDTAISEKSHMTANFRRAYHEGGGKLHVFLVLLNGANAQWVPVSTAGGTGNSGYVLVDTTINTFYGGTWQVKMKGVAFHEYFHGIQNSYNKITNNNIWFHEATAVWASCYYGKDWMHVKDYYTGAGTVFSDTNQPLWPNTNRKYSLSTLAFYYVQHLGGYGFIKSFLEGTVTLNDPMLNLQALLGDSFGEQYRTYLMALHAKNIAAIKNYTPNVTPKNTFSQYGGKVTGDNVVLTGAQYYEFNAEPGNKGPALIVTFKKSDGSGNVEGFLMKDKKVKKYTFDDDGRTYFKGFGHSPKQVVLIVTDVNYSGQDTNPRGFEFGAYLPYIKIHKFTVQSPVIHSGEKTSVDCNYDLLGCDPSSNPFRMQVQMKEAKPHAIDLGSGLFTIPADFPVGLNQDNPRFWFDAYNTAPAKYTMRYDLRVPQDSWKMPQSKSSGTYSVQVLP
jgi:hypothetical protein